MARSRCCPCCGSRALLFEQVAVGVVATLRRGRLEMISEPLTPLCVRARCTECRNEWRLRNVRSLAELDAPTSG